jgi:hypothetical protein
MPIDRCRRASNGYGEMIEAPAIGRGRGPGRAQRGWSWLRGGKSLATQAQPGAALTGVKPPKAAGPGEVEDGDRGAEGRS